MLSLAWLVGVAVVVELCVSMVGCYRTGWHVLCRGTQIFLLQAGVQGGSTIGFSVVLFVQVSGSMLSLEWLVGWLV